MLFIYGEPVDEHVSYPVDRLSFWLVAVAGSLITLIIIKHWRNK